MFEYAISQGEGTLIDYGRAVSLDDISVDHDGTLIIALAAPDCETGE